MTTRMLPGFSRTWASRRAAWSAEHEVVATPSSRPSGPWPIVAHTITGHESEEYFSPSANNAVPNRAGSSLRHHGGARWMLRALGAIAMLLTTGSCGTDEPALVITLQVNEATGVDLDTSNIRGFLLRVGDEQVPFTARPREQFRIEFSAPPEGPTDVVLYACELIAACQPGTAAFVGCSRPNLVARDTPQSVFVALYPMPGENEPAPAGCADMDLRLPPAR
jgi:hypothetical protein